MVNFFLNGMTANFVGFYRDLNDKTYPEGIIFERKFAL